MLKKSANHARANSENQMTASERLKAMKECLKVAAQIRQELQGRTHSNSTDLVAEDRRR